MTRRGPTIAEAVRQQLEDRGPQPVEALAEVLAARGVTAARDPVASVRAVLQREAAFIATRDGRWWLTARRLDGVVLTTRLTSVERRRRAVVVHGALSGLAPLLPQPRYALRRGEADRRGLRRQALDEMLDPGGRDRDWMDEERDAWDWEAGLPVAGVGLPADDEELPGLEEVLLSLGERPDPGPGRWAIPWQARGLAVLSGPPDWLPFLAPRDLLGLRVVDGGLDAVAVPPWAVEGPGVGPAMALLRDLAGARLGPDESWFGPGTTSLGGLAALAVTEWPERFRDPLPPLADLLERAGLRVEGDEVSHPGVVPRSRWSPVAWPRHSWEAAPRGVVPPLPECEAA